ncbi:MAG TPA: methylthioribulose 1-phosphate dehydratase [Blastocatellia bacterium]|nr:methylthioribulose 1-phosphate dehydratase [Blastocatellia bacterium]
MLNSESMGLEFQEAARQLAEVGRDFHRRGWALGTSGNFSAVIKREPLKIAITASGLDKGALSAEHILEVPVDDDALGAKHILDAGPDGQSVQPVLTTQTAASNTRVAIQRSLKPSSETIIHLAVARATSAGSVLHTHSVWSTLLSESFAPDAGLALEGYEMLKGLAGVTTHLHREWLPILDNTQDWAAAAPGIESLLKKDPNLHGFLIRGHGLYTWGSNLIEARRHVEILEFLLEVKGRLFCAGRT